MLIDKLCEETQKDLKVKAETCLSFMKFYEHAMNEQPGMLSEDDHGLYKISQGYIMLYALVVKGELPSC